MPTLADDTALPTTNNGPSIWLLPVAVVLTAMAAGMGWGIRGQYGHETGAMIAGVLAGFTLVMLFGSKLTSLGAARAVALMALGVSFGGSMTYGQTVGLTHDGPLIGNTAALRWGLFGLFVKGGVWIGFAGAFLGMGLSGKRYRPLEMAIVIPALVGLFFVGVWALNRPYDPAHRVLPTLYFSDDWFWEPGSELKPRPECWGGLLVALAALIGYLTLVRRDALARNMALIGFLAGGIGFASGQSVQAFHAWNRELVDSTLPEFLSPHVNWWNMMEITFGMVFGGILAAGLWFNRHLIARSDDCDKVELTAPWELALLAAHLTVLVDSGFLGLGNLRMFAEFGLMAAFYPIIGILAGRYWPYLFALPVVMVPIAGKTLRELSFQNTEVSEPVGWVTLVALPLAIATVSAIALARRGRRGQSPVIFAATGLLLSTWLYFGLNFAFFRVPWPWETWTGRTPSGIIFMVCSICLSVAAVVCLFRTSRKHAADSEAIASGN